MTSIYKKTVTMAKACEECTQNCLLMHKKKKDPASVVTTFFKVMMGEEYSKLLVLPPIFARCAKKLVDKTTHLEDFNGEKWDVRFTKINDHLAFEEGWNAFALAHGLQQGDFLVFHYIMKSHFVVLMYGSTGCPENRHYGFHHHPVKETKKNSNNLMANGQSPSEVLTNCNNFSHESSSKSEPLVNRVNHLETSNKKPNNDRMSPDENAANTQHLVASSSRLLGKETEPLVQNTDKETEQRSELLIKNTNKETDQTSEPLAKTTDKETDQRFEPLVQNTIPDSKSSKSVKPFCLVDNSNGHEQDECRSKSLQPVVVGSDGGQKNNVAAVGGGSGKTENNSIREVFETRREMAAEKRKESTMRQSEVPDSNPMHKRLRTADASCTRAKIIKKEPDTFVSRLHNSSHHFASIEISPKPTAKHIETIKREPTTNHGSVGLMKKEPAMNHGLDGLIKKEPTMNHGSGGLIKRVPKPEPVDYDEAPLSGSSNTSFSAVMSSYQYLELPEWVKLKSRVILLRNGTDLWPVLYQAKFGLKALTRNWETFAKVKGLQPGDNCEFVLESEPNSRFTCNVFSVHVTR